MSTVKYKPEIAIIIPTYKRDDLLMECIHSILEHWQDNWKILILDQNPFEDDSFEKTLFYATACAPVHARENRQIEVIRVEPDSGLNYTRNRGVAEALAQGIPYCLISADSILFDASLRHLNDAVEALSTPEYQIDLLGLDLRDYPTQRESFLKLVPFSHFEVDFIDLNTEPDYEIIRSHADFVNPMFEEYYTALGMWKCDIVRNFFIAKTEALAVIGWDQEFKFGGNEDFFWRFKTLGKYRTAFTTYLKGIYSNKGNQEFNETRENNLDQSKRVLRRKYKLGEQNER